MLTWLDVDNDGCLTRYNILARELLNGEADDKSCEIKSGSVLIIIVET